MPKLPSYRNQSIYLLCKSIDWFLSNDIFGVYWVNKELLLEVSFITTTSKYQGNFKGLTKTCSETCSWIEAKDVAFSSLNNVAKTCSHRLKFSGKLFFHLIVYCLVLGTFNKSRLRPFMKLVWDIIKDKTDISLVSKTKLIAHDGAIL